MNKKILIVEDEFIVADDLQLTLQQAGYEVCGIAASVNEAMALIDKKKPGLVLLDIHLRGKLSGIDLARQLKEQDIAFVYLSANSNQQILEAAKSTEPYGFLIKPFREKDLLVTVDIAFYRHEHSLEARWHREIQLQKALLKIAEEALDLKQKLIKAVSILQHYIPFELIAGKTKKPTGEHYTGFGILRVGFDEYKVLRAHELAVISGRSKEEITAMLDNASDDKIAGYYNDADFIKLSALHPVKGVFAKKFGFSSNLILPLLYSDGYTFSISLYRSVKDGYTAEQFDWIVRLQQPLTAVLSSIPQLEKEAFFLDQPKAERIISAGEYLTAPCFKNIIGSSTALLNVLDLVKQVAPLNTSVLLLGESGTGKEKIADCIHELSPRNGKPFIKVNCAALPPSLIESELFGYEKGAFTGALEKRIGKFELADGGTIFLDEIGEVPAELQVKLLRVLQEREIERIGGRQSIKVDVRIIAATNRNLEKEMAEGRFRLDLYYRLNVFPVTLPALRERKEDIRELAYLFAEKCCKKFNKTLYGISSEMLAEMEAYEWPGNIRELENIIEQSVILNNGNSQLVLRRALVTSAVDGSFMHQKAEGTTIKTIGDIKRLQRQTEIEHIAAVLVQTKGRIRGKNGAAELLNEKPTTLESRMAKLGIKKEDFQ